MKKLAGFWELPEASEVAGASLKQQMGHFRHMIVNIDHHVMIWEATIRRKPAGLRWFTPRQLALLPLSTATRKALRLAGYDL